MHIFIFPARFSLPPPRANSSVSGTDKTTYTYDANGNLVRSENAGGARSYAYNALNLLQSFTREDGYTETYTYNANRLLSEIRTSEDLTTALTWDILYGDGVVISAAQNGKSTNYTYGLERISAISGSTRTEYVYDGRGSVAAELSYNNAWYTFGGGLARKNVVSKSYSPFGELLTENTSGFGYNGEYYNAATGMIYLRARFYAPEMNRFGQKDSLRGSVIDGISLNRYLYCQSDPVNFKDVNGLKMVPVDFENKGGGSGRDNSRYARTTASSTTASNQPPTFQEYLAQNNYDPFNPRSRWSRTDSNYPSWRQGQSTLSSQASTPQTSSITRESPSVQNVTGSRGYSCGRERIGDGASQIIKGAFYVGVGIAALAVASTAGLPVILALFAAGITTGTVAYGAAEMGEGIDSIIYGSRGDTTTVVYNPLRDGVFGGNQNSYDAFGHASISGSFGVGVIAPEWESISSTASNLWNSTRNSNVSSNNESAHYLHRPYIRKATIDAVNNNTEVNYETGEIWDSISGKWVNPSDVELGHVTGREYWYLRDWAESQGMTQEEFNDFMNNPSFYAWQNVHDNRGHFFEDPH